MRVVLSTKLIIGTGVFSAETLTREQATAWVKDHQPVNYCGHESVRLVGLVPAKDRKTCEGYEQALAITAKARLEFGREYTVAEIEALGGAEYTLITRVA